MRNRLVIMLFPFLAALSLLFYVIGKTNPRHLELESCNSCHLTSNKVKAENAHQLISSQELLCKRCHPKELLVSHPTGFEPKRQIPEIFPLDWKGELTCSSCHDIHGESPGLMRTALRGRGYCLSCHEEEFFEKMADLGIALVSSGHLVSSSPDNSIFEDIDSFSLECLECHGEQTDQLFVSINSMGIINHSGQKADHPIGRDYRQAMRSGGYHSIEQLPEYILVPEGKVSCVSCHEGYSQVHGKLVESNARSQLCLRCHDI